MGPMNRWLGVAATLALASCKEPAPPPKPDLVLHPPSPQAQAAAAAKPAPPPAPLPAGEVDVKSAARAANEFGFDLWRAARRVEQNVILSPWSVNHALAMASAGARGETEAALARVLHRPGGAPEWHAALGQLEQTLVQRGAGKKGKSGPFRVRVFNQLYPAQSLPLERDFTAFLKERYRAAVHPLDFAGDAEGARKVINEDVSKATEQKIPELLVRGSVDPATALFLVNAVYFNAAWAARFEPRLTADAPFFKDDGTQGTVKLMASVGRHDVSVSGRLAARHMLQPDGSVRVFEPQDAPPVEDGIEVLQLPYMGGEVSLVVLLPPQGKLVELEQSLTAERFEALVARPKTAASANVYLPRFEVRTPIELLPALVSMGLGPIARPSADFTGISSVRPMFVSKVVHQAFIKSDEAGTEAAAATGLGMLLGAGPPKVAEIRVDRPFLFFIRDVPTGTVLFMGRYVSPEK
jgi:serpin B